MASCSIILGVIENFIPTPVPAIRLGLANVPIIIMLYLAGSKYAFQVSFLKALIVPVLSANIIFKMSVKGLIYTNIAGILLLSAVITGILMGIIAYKIVNHKQIKSMFERLELKG